MPNSKNYYLKKIKVTGLIILLLLVGEFLSHSFLQMISRRSDKLFVHSLLSRVYYFDVGQGDSTLISGPDGTNILIDGGPDLSVIYELGEALPFYDRQIDLMILTHPDYDHLVGLIEVLERYQVEEIFINGIIDDSPAYQYFLQRIKDKNLNLRVVSAGDSFTRPDHKAEILYPFVNMSGKAVSDNNSTSLVIKIAYGDISLLFTGDLPQTQESELLSSGLNLHSAIVKAGHHGSKTSTSLTFLQAVAPDWVVISAGEGNRYGHPHYRVLATIRKVGGRILRTDWQGTIKFVFLPDNIAVVD